MPLEEFIIKVYLKVSDLFALSLANNKLRLCGVCPNLSDEEVLTMEIVGEYLGLGMDKKIWRYFKTHWREWFPKIGSSTSFARQAANLFGMKKQMFEHLSHELTQGKDVYLFDGFPIPICHIKRYKRSKNALKSEAAVGYCAAKDEKYFGFKGHLLITQTGAINSFELVRANIDERDVLPELALGLKGHILADKGLIRPDLTRILKEKGIALHTPLRSNMKDNRPKHLIKHLMNIRRVVETVIGQLVDRFTIQTIRAKDLWHLNAKVIRKILAHNIFFSINSFLNPDTPLQFLKLTHF